MSWQKRVRALLAAGVLALAAGITWYVTRERTLAEAPVVAARTDSGCETEISGEKGFNRLDNETGAVIFQLKYDYGCVYKAENRTRLVNVSGTMMRGDQPITFRADEADIKRKSGVTDIAKFDEMHMRGKVLVKSGPGAEVLHLESEEAIYNDLTGILSTDKPAKVRRGNMSGSGTGMTFDRNRSVVWLLANARVSIATADQGTVKVTSTRAGLAEAEKYMRFEENVRMEREGRVIVTDAAVANLTP